jgi:ribosomal protein L21E
VGHSYRSNEENMADKNVTFTEPTASDITQIIIRYNAGAVESIEIGCSVAGSDPNASFQGNIDAVPSDFSSSVQTAFGDLATEAAAKVVTDKSF